MLVNFFQRCVKKSNFLQQEAIQGQTKFSKFQCQSTILWLLIGFTLAFFVFFQQLQFTSKIPQFINKHKYFTYNLQLEEPHDFEQLCQIPKIHPFDPSIISYISTAKLIKCKSRQESLTFIDSEGILRFNESSLTNSGYVNGEAPSCTYQEIIRPKGEDFEVSYGKKMILQRNGTKLHAEFVYVSCYNIAGISFYTNIHLHVIPLAIKNKINNKYNILIVGIDSLSRQSFMRYLPETYSYLTEQMQAFVFRGMTKVGDNTFPNLVPLLTGKSVEENEVQTKTQFNEWPCIWKKFSERGYVTMLAEDRPDIALFNYLRAGFNSSPTDHYLRPFWLAVETSALHTISSSLCFGSIPKHQLQLNYTRDFAKKYSEKSYFGFSFFVELSHDYMNQVSEADKDFKYFLNDLHFTGTLNNTFLLFLSDHGHRFDKMRATLVGRIEERMPFFALVIPPSFAHSNPEIIHIIKSNLGRLTSPYDIYFTMLNIMLHGDEFKKTNTVRGHSLFTSISPNRTCKSAGIPDHYCICEEHRKLNVNDDLSISAAIVLLENINYLLERTNINTSICSILKLKKIHRADLIIPNNKLNSRNFFDRLINGEESKSVSKLRIIIETSPGNALFESTLTHTEDRNEIAVLGDISRINKYGKQSWCVNDTILRKYCYCYNETSTSN